MWDMKVKRFIEMSREVNIVECHDINDELDKGSTGCFEDRFGDIYYLINGKYHREDGPAYIGYHEDGSIKCESYYIEDKRLSKEDFLKRTQSCSGKIVEIDGKKYKLTEL